MQVHYISRWKPSGMLRFRLAGVIVVQERDVAVYSPPHHEDEAALQDLLCDWDEVRPGWQSSVDWLAALAESGNGITVEYSPVKQLETDASSSTEAARLAYEEARREYGVETEPEPLEGPVELISLGTERATKTEPEPLEGPVHRISVGTAR